jgi:hypothetical protein
MTGIVPERDEVTMNRQWKQLSLGTLLGFTLLVAGCGESGTSTISQVSNTGAPAALKVEAEVPAERGAETVAAAGNLARVEAPSGDVTMERCMAQRRYLVFHTSEALDPVNDTNGINDVYLRDLLTGRVTLVSKTSAGLAGNGPSSYATISSDGKRIAYQSLASDLVTGDSNGKSDVFLYTRVGQVTTRVSLTASNGQANDDSSFPALSSNGSFLAFVSKADLTGVGTAGIQNLYLRKVDGSSTKLFSRGSGTGANAHVYFPVMSSDSRFIAYTSSASNLVAGDSNGTSDVFLYDRATGLTQRVSVDSAGGQADGSSSMPSVSDDGNVIAFESKATNLVAGDSNGLRDLFVRNRSAGTTTRVSVDANGAQPNGISYHATLTRDGNRVAFASQASNLVAGDTNNVADVFQRLVADPTSIARASRNIVGDVQGDGPSDLPSYDSDDNDLAFRSSSTNLDWANVVNNNEIFLANRASQTAHVVGRAWTASQVKVGLEFSIDRGTTLSPKSQSADGRLVVYSTPDATLVPGDTNGEYDVFVRDNKTGVSERVSVDSSGNQAIGPSGAARRESISSNGRFVAFFSFASNLVAGDINGAPDIFLHDRVTKVTSLVNLGIELSNSPFDLAVLSNPLSPVVSDDGRYVAFGTTNVGTPYPKTFGDVYLLDRIQNRYSLISVNSQGVQGNGLSILRSMSSDGRFVAFSSTATNLVANDSNGAEDLFVNDRLNGTTVCVSVKPDGSPSQLGGASREAKLSADGRTIVFSSAAKDLVAETGVGNSYIYVRNLQTQTTKRLPLDTVDQAGFFRLEPGISADGRFVVHRRLPQLDSFSTLVLTDLKGSVSVPFPIIFPGFDPQPQALEGTGLSPDGRFVGFTSSFYGFVGAYIGGPHIARILFP